MFMEVMCRWTPGAGGGKANNCYTKLCEARGDLYPMIFFAIVITGRLRTVHTRVVITIIIVIIRVNYFACSACVS